MNSGLLNNTDLASLGVEAGLVVVLLLLIFWMALKLLRNSLVFIPNTSYGIVERKWGRSRGDSRFAPMALGSGAGFLPEVLSGGWHVLTPFKYIVHKRERITVDGIAYLMARVGAPLAEGQALAEWPAGVATDDARGFLAKGGQRGPQRRILRSGTYAPNLALFCVITEGKIHSHGSGNAEDDRQMHALLADRRAFDPVVITDDTIGIVTVQDGPALQHGEIVAPSVGTDPADTATFHNSFQDTSKFLAAGGRRGRQEAVLVDGTYYINRLFATVETKPKTKVEIGTVAVVNSYVGAENREALTAEQRPGPHGAARQPRHLGISVRARQVPAEPLRDGGHGRADDQLSATLDQRHLRRAELRRGPARDPRHHRRRVRDPAAAVHRGAHLADERAARDPALLQRAAPGHADAGPVRQRLFQGRRAVAHAAGVRAGPPDRAVGGAGHDA